MFPKCLTRQKKIKKIFYTLSTGTAGFIQLLLLKRIADEVQNTNEAHLSG